MRRVFATDRPRLGAAIAAIGAKSRRELSSARKSSVRKGSYAHVKSDTDSRPMQEHISGG